MCVGGCVFVSKISFICIFQKVRQGKIPPNSQTNLAFTCSEWNSTEETDGKRQRSFLWQEVVVNVFCLRFFAIKDKWCVVLKRFSFTFSFFLSKKISLDQKTQVLGYQLAPLYFRTVKFFTFLHIQVNLFWPWYAVSEKQKLTKSLCRFSKVQKAQKACWQMRLPKRTNASKTGRFFFSLWQKCHQTSKKQKSHQEIRREVGIKLQNVYG